MSGDMPDMRAYNYSAKPLSWGGNQEIKTVAIDDAVRRLQQDFYTNTVASNQLQIPNAIPKEKPLPSAKRLVEVYIVDPDENVPVEKSVLHESKRLLTDLTDQELFFEINVKQLLDTHNEMRQSTQDKQASIDKGTAVFLEPVKIRDLKMLVVTIASF